MLNNRLAAAQMISQRLASCEDAIDDALARAAELTSAVPAARRTANVSPVVGQDAIALTGEAMAALYEARAKMVAAHHAMAEVRDELGLRTRMAGDMWKAPSASAVPLRIVDAEAA